LPPNTGLRKAQRGRSSVKAKNLNSWRRGIQLRLPDGKGREEVSRPKEGKECMEGKKRGVQTRANRPPNIVKRS